MLPYGSGKTIAAQDSYMQDNVLGIETRFK